MQCTNCGNFIAMNEPYYRAGWNKTIFCSYMCVQEMYKDLCTKEEIEGSMEQYNLAE